MKVYNKRYSYYCGIDLHARTLFVCILNDAGQKVYHKNIPCKPDRFLQAIEPYRKDIVVGVECIFWLDRPKSPELAALDWTPHPLPLFKSIFEAMDVDDFSPNRRGSVLPLPQDDL
jgi:hypothetical protein